MSAGGSVTIAGTASGPAPATGASNSDSSVTAGSSGTSPLRHWQYSGYNTNFGVYLKSSHAVSAGGSVTIAGTGGGTSSDNYGARVESSVSAGGSVAITGTSHGTGANNYGVEISSSVTAGSDITISGSGSVNGSGTDFGVYVESRQFR